MLRPLAGELRAGAHALSREVVDAIREQVPDLFPDEETFEELRAATESNLVAFATAVESGADPVGIELPAATASYARDSAQRGLGLPLILRAWRVGQGVVWDGLIAQLAARARDAEELAIATRLASAWLFAHVDRAATLTEQTYTAERERWMRSASAVRAETIDALLEGRERDADVASSRLRYALDLHHVGVVAWLDAAEESSDPIRSLEGAIADLAQASGSDATLVHPVGLLSVVAWLGSRARFDPAVLEALSFDALAAPGVLVAVGSPAPGVAGFRTTNVEAGHARRVATLIARRPGTVTHFARVSLAALTTSDLALAREFVERELGELQGEDDVSMRLAATLRAYLNENCSRSRAAKRLGVHENTISYRIRQAEEILGRSVDRDALDLRVALALAGAVHPRR